MVSQVLSLYPLPHFSFLSFSPSLTVSPPSPPGVPVTSSVLAFIPLDLAVSLTPLLSVTRSVFCIISPSPSLPPL